MGEALSLAQKAFEMGEVPVGAVVVSDGVVIGEGWNQPISAHDPSAHAEVLALRSAAAHCENYRLPGATLYVTIEPCTMCLGAMIHARITRVVFGALEPKAGVLSSHSHLIDADIYNHRIEWRSGVRSDECMEIIQRFFKMRREAKKASKKAAK